MFSKPRCIIGKVTHPSRSFAKPRSGLHAFPRSPNLRVNVADATRAGLHPYSAMGDTGLELGLGVRWGRIPWIYWGSVPSDQLQFAQIATKIATKARGKPRR